MKKIFLIALILIALVAFFASYKYYVEHQNDVDQNYVKEHMGKPGVVLLDVRPLDVYNGKAPRAGLHGGHIEGAINFPLADIIKLVENGGSVDALTKAGITKDVNIIIYCNTGKHASDFANILVRNFGFDRSRLKIYRGSAVDWLKNPENKVIPEDHE